MSRQRDDGLCCRGWFGPAQDHCLVRPWSPPQRFELLGRSPVAVNFDSNERGRVAWTRPDGVVLAEERAQGWSTTSVRSPFEPTRVVLVVGSRDRVVLGWSGAEASAIATIDEAGAWNEVQTQQGTGLQVAVGTEHEQRIRAWVEEGQARIAVEGLDDGLGPGRALGASTTDEVQLVRAGNDQAAVMWSDGLELVVSERWSRDDPFTGPAVTRLVAAGAVSPSIATGRFAQLAVAFVEPSPFGDRLVVLKRRGDAVFDRGDSQADPLEGWSRDDALLEPQVGVRVTDPNVVVTDRGVMFVAWVLDGQMMVARYEDQRWTDRGSRLSIAHAAQAPSLAAGPDDEVVVVWIEAAENRSCRLMAARRQAGPGAWGKPEVVRVTTASLGATLGHPEVTIGAQGRTLVAWSEDGQIWRATVELGAR